MGPGKGHCLEGIAWISKCKLICDAGLTVVQNVYDETFRVSNGVPEGRIWSDESEYQRGIAFLHKQRRNGESGGEVASSIRRPDRDRHCQPASEATDRVSLFGRQLERVGSDAPEPIVEAHAWTLGGDDDEGTGVRGQG
jgi:hypothetical protein